MTSNKEIYRIWAATQHKLPIWLQPWWLDAVCAGKDWDVLLVTQKSQKDDSESESNESVTIADLQKIVGAMPYLIRQRWWFRFVLMPQMTQVCGPWIAEGADVNYVAKEFQRQLDELKLDYYYQHFPLRSSLAHSFRKAGYYVKERITYRIEDTSDMDTIQRHFSRDKRRQLKVAEEAGFTLETQLRGEEFYQYHKRWLAQKKKEPIYTREMLLVLERKTQRASQSCFLGARNKKGEIEAAVFLVWDAESVYYLIQCHDHRRRKHHANEWLLYKSIEFAHEKGLAFDFEGSMIPGVATYFKQFGGDPTIYHSVEKRESLLFKAAMWLQNQRWRHMR